MFLTHDDCKNCCIHLTTRNVCLNIQEFIHDLLHHSVPVLPVGTWLPVLQCQVLLEGEGKPHASQGHKNPQPHIHQVLTQPTYRYCPYKDVSSVLPLPILYLQK